MTTKYYQIMQETYEEKQERERRRRAIAEQNKSMPALARVERKLLNERRRIVNQATEEMVRKYGEFDLLAMSPAKRLAMLMELDNRITRITKEEHASK